jgi:CheY-like chemotaxis protein
MGSQYPPRVLVVEDEFLVREMIVEEFRRAARRTRSRWC